MEKNEQKEGRKGEVNVIPEAVEGHELGKW